ncbi:MAG: class I SAM-dependent methyltransferase [Planctomycetes bacterium]|nr:class I SAM-dependent methyltransferase [Planctomycetota bacterium]
MHSAPFEVRTEHVVCPMCALDRPAPYRARMYRIGETRFDLVRCPCGFVYVDPRPDGPTLGKMYDDADYYTDGYNLGVETENYFERRDELLVHYDGVVAELERTICKPGDLLELGSAGGFFLEAARRRGWRVKGIEISPPAVEYSRREMKLDIHSGDLFEAPFAPRSFDLVVADNVLEHTTNPQKVLEKLRSLLKPGGRVLVIVPSYVNSPFFRLILFLQRVVPRRFLGEQLVKILKLDPDADPKGGGYPYHILEFDRATLTALVKRAGFEVERVEGSVPLPAEVFKAKRTTPRVLVLRAIFRTLDFGMRVGVLPGARLTLVARA